MSTLLEAPNPAQSGTHPGDLVAQTVTAHDAGITVNDYLAARAVGADHDQILQVVAPPYSPHLPNYVRIRAAGATHQQLLEARRAKVAGLAYAELRAFGATHDEALEAYDLGYVQCYIIARQAGCTHPEIVAACHADLTPIGYMGLRTTGLSHAEVMHANTLSPHEYHNYVTAHRRSTQD
jgi:hypothetical protein